MSERGELRQGGHPPPRIEESKASKWKADRVKNSKMDFQLMCITFLSK